MDETHATLAASPDLRRSLGIRRLPTAPTVAAPARRVEPSYLQRRIVTLARPSAHAPLHLAGDGPGRSTRRLERWLAAKVRSGVRHRFVKLHALVSARARFPVFRAADVTDAYTNDTTELPNRLDPVPRGVPLGSVVLVGCC